MLAKEVVMKNNNVFAKANFLIKCDIENYVRSWLPYGKKEGIYYLSLNPNRNDRNLGSFKVNLQNGVWYDFATGDGGNIVNLYAYINYISDFEAACRIVDRQYMSDFSFSHYMPSKVSKVPKVRARRNFVRLWRQCLNPAGTLVEKYLKNRGYVGQLPDSIKFHPELKYANDYFPAMVSAIRKWPDNSIVGIHRTFLHEDGSRKACVENPKKILGCASGGSIQLSKISADEPLIITEGIEDGLSIYLATRQPVWSAISASLMPKVNVPRPNEIKKIIIAADNNAPGIKNALKLAVRLMECDYKVSLIAPKELGVDYNDLLLRGEVR